MLEKTFAEGIYLHKEHSLHEVLSELFNLLGEENLQQQDIVSLHLIKATLPLCQTPGRDRTCFGKASLLPHRCHLQRKEQKWQFYISC